MIKLISQLLQDSLVRMQRDRMRSELLILSDHALQDAGFSRELLLEGVQAWPWKASPEETPAPLNLSAMEGRRVRSMGSRAAVNRDEQDELVA